jgi:hypothetical protein
LAALHLVFSILCAMALRGDQRSQLVHRRGDPLLAYVAPNADPIHGQLHLPSARHLLSQHSARWYEWSSPGELIHPCDFAECFERHEQPVQTCLQDGYSQPHSRGWPRSDLAADLSRRSRGAESGRGQPLIGLPQRVARASGTSPIWLSGACGGKCRGTARFATMVLNQCFWTDEVACPFGLLSPLS